MKKVLIIGFGIFCFFSSYGQKKNPYHTKDTKEYTEVTSKLIGVWNIESFGKKNDEKIGNVYEKATVEFKEFDEEGKNGVAIFRFVIPKSTVDERIAVWNKKETTLNVESYVVVATVKFKIHKKGVLVYFEDQINHPEISGSGDQLENFQGTETAFITSQSQMKQSGGIGNLVAAKMTKTITGTDFVPNIPNQVNYKDLTDTSVDLITLQKINFKLTK